MQSTRRMFPIAAIALAALMLAVASEPAQAVPTVDPTLFNANTNGAGDAAPGLGTNFTSSAALYTGATGAKWDDPREAFGRVFTGGAAEAGNFLFADPGNPTQPGGHPAAPVIPPATADNGNLVLGDANEVVDFIQWETTSPVILYGYRAGVTGDRPTQLVRFSVEGEVDDLFDNNNANGPVDRLFAIPQVGDSFRFDLTRGTNAGPRITEIDAITNPTVGAVVNPTIWNATTNTGGDDPAGLSTNFVASSAYFDGVATFDTVEDAFGNNNGNIEGNTFIFGDVQSVDNGDNLFGTGGETVSSISWHTILPIQLEGYQVEVSGTGDPRVPELMRLSVEGNVVSVIDLNGFGGSFLMMFDGGPVIGDDFKIEFTHFSGTFAPRIFEINAVNAFAIIVVPEPATASLALLGLGGLMMRRRRTA